MSLFTFQNVNKHLSLIEPHPHQKPSAWRYTRKQMQRKDRSNNWTQTPFSLPQLEDEVQSEQS